ncbi:MAG: hypothetical protein ACI9WS_002879 [Paraglaciecola psychrophila]|jgi:uncharacterized protein (DUF58 family)
MGFTVTQNIRQFFNARFQQFINRQIPPGHSITLDRHVIFIFPSKAGLWFGMLLLLMLLAAVNYQNNMAFALVFFLSSLFIVTIMHTFANLSGLSFKALRAGPAFVGDSVPFELLLSREGSKSYFDINIYWPHSEVQLVTLMSQQQRVKLHLTAARRGLFKPGRLKVETFYPLGLLRAWTWIELDWAALIYPAPLACEYSALSLSDSDHAAAEPVPGSEDFYQFRHYQAGDTLKHLFWKGYAKGGELQTKQFVSYRQQSSWLNWDNVDGSVETRLQKLCYQVLELEKSGRDYGLKLPAQSIAPDQGERHLQRVLTALAKFNGGGAR